MAEKANVLCANLSQIVQVLGLGIARLRSLPPWHHGVQGDFRNDAEEWFFGAIMIVGGASLLVTAVWKGLVIQGEIRHDKESAAGFSEDQVQLSRLLKLKILP